MLKDILSGVVLEGADLDSLLSAGIHDTDIKHTGNVNESVPEKIVVSSDDDDDDDLEEVVETSNSLPHLRGVIHCIYTELRVRPFAYVSTV